MMKFNRTMNCVSSYYITLVARDLDAAAGSKEETFQVRVDEQSFGKLDMTVSVARRKDETGAFFVLFFILYKSKVINLSF